MSAPLPPRDRRGLFDSVVELYDRARPTYPAALFDDIVALAGVPGGGRVLEIGCGTGQATLPMARRGYRITAVELGANLAAVARRKLARYGVDVQVGAFEEWPLPDDPFDLVLCVTAFHWLDAAVALPKMARALRPGGAIAITSGGHVAGGTEQFFVDSQECYVAHMPGTPPGIRLKTPDEIPLESPASIVECGLFEPARLRRYVWLRDFTTQTYIDEINTYSSHIELSGENRAALLACVRELIDSQYGGRITKAYHTDLAVAAVR
ncbi:MAG TPA: class I SAM-dependent methyltransferase, partial [Dehalococcoidia bacterium]|nr:class I SAM-dependent methyltransferase [Dehalococcoidia bacterium]